MKRLTVTLLTLMLLAFPVSSLVWGQTLIQQSPTMLNACNGVQHQDAAINTTITLTITAPAGQYVYLCGWDYQVCQNGTAAAQNNVTWTTTNLPGTPKWQYSIPATIQACQTGVFYFRSPLKASAPGTNVTIVSPAVNAQAAYSANAYYYFAP